ncbi:MAG: MFS transporter [Peptococcaceae bacterium]|nr:MAG: MFS transporter [Peptococcaceae bacterium]
MKDKFSLAAISGVPLSLVLGNSMLIPVLPAIKESLALSQFEVSLVITLFSVPAGLIIPLAGFLSDRLGRKNIIIPSLILYGLGGIVAGLAAIYFKSGAYPWVLGGRIIQGIGAAGTGPVAMALSADLFTGRERSKSLGILETANGLGKLISPILGAAIGLIAWYAAFLFFPLVVIPIVLAVWFMIKEPAARRKPESPAEYLKSLGKIFSRKSMALTVSFLAGMTVLLILFGILFFLSEYLEEKYNINGVLKGVALAIPVFFMCAASFGAGILVKKKFGLMKTLVVAGLAVIAGSLAAIPACENIYLFFTAISLAGAGTGLVLTCLNTLITSASGSDERGMVTALYGSVRFFGVAIGPPLFGFLMGYGRTPMAWSASGLALLVAVLALLLLKTKNLTAQQAT